MYINGQSISFDQEKNLLEVIRKAGIELPTFCYYSELSIYGACRMCLVEEEKRGIMAACSDIPRDGYRIWTHTPALQTQRKRTMELLLANHPRECTVCSRNADCKLREISHKLGVTQIRFGELAGSAPVDSSSASIIRDPNKCILCGDCVRMCEEVQGVGVIGFAYRGSEATVTTAFNKPLAEVDCIDCGQCAAVCPTGALHVKEQMDQVWAAIHDPGKLVVAQIAPAVKVAFGEAFGMQPGEAATGKIIAALKKIGFDQVYDTSFAADLTVIEESFEFSRRLEQGEKLPLFTTCCPSWVKYAELHYPQLLDHLSTCRSPQQMFGALAKSYLRQQTEKDIYVVSIMPCTAKKFEAGRPEFSSEGQPQVDVVLTTQELIKMVETAGIAFGELEEDIFDMPFGFSTGSGNIFGVTGGVTEAVLRNLAVDQVFFKQLRGAAGVKEAQVEKDGHLLKIAVIHGLGNAKTFLDQLGQSDEKYHLVEIMACPGGCIGGAGQPCPPAMKIREKRGKGLYALDRGMQLNLAKDNPIAARMYQLWLKEPGSEEAHRHLHTSYHSRKRIQLAEMTFGDEAPETPPQTDRQAEISVCVGTCCYTKGSYDLFQTFYHAIAERKLEKRVSLQATFCLENCQGSPCIKIGDKIMGQVSQADVADLLSDL
jgi:NADH-quinone oxidoreductase subunit G